MAFRRPRVNVKPNVQATRPVSGGVRSQESTTVESTSTQSSQEEHVTQQDEIPTIPTVVIGKNISMTFSIKRLFRFVWFSVRITTTNDRRENRTITTTTSTATTTNISICFSSSCYICSSIISTSCFNSSSKTTINSKKNITYYQCQNNNSSSSVSWFLSYFILSHIVCLSF